jgi:hypothetical protein
MGLSSYRTYSGTTVAGQGPRESAPERLPVREARREAPGTPVIDQLEGRRAPAKQGFSNRVFGSIYPKPTQLLPSKAVKSIYRGISTAVQAVGQLGECYQLEQKMSKARQDHDYTDHKIYAEQYEKVNCGSVPPI